MLTASFDDPPPWRRLTSRGGIRHPMETEDAVSELGNRLVPEPTTLQVLVVGAGVFLKISVVGSAVVLTGFHSNHLLRVDFYPDRISGKVNKRGPELDQHTPLHERHIPLISFPACNKAKRLADKARILVASQNGYAISACFDI